MQQRTLLNISAGAVIAGILLAVAAAVHFHGIYSQQHGPTAIAVGEDSIAVARLATIDVLDSEGALRASIATSELGIADTQSDLAFLPDGRLLVAYGSDGMPAACDIVNRKCNAFLRGATTLAVVKLAVDTAGVWIADSDNHRVLRTGLDGKLRSVAINQGLAFPNSILHTGDALVLCDTNHSRVLRYPLDGERVGDAVVLMDEEDVMNARPISIAPNTAGWWLLIADQNMGHGKLFRYDTHGGLLARVPLPGAEDPAALRAWRGGALIADTNGFQLLQVTAAAEVSPFGDARYQETLSAIRQNVRDARLANTLSLACLVVLLIAAILIALQEQRLRAAATPAPSMDADIIWLDGPRAPALRVRIVVIASLASLLVLPMAISAMSLFTPLVALAILLAPWAVVMLVFHLAVRRKQRTETSIVGLGVGRNTIVVRTGDGYEQHYAIAEIPWSKRALHLPDRLLLLRDSDGWLYPEQQVRNILVPRMSRRTRLGLG